MKKIFIILTLLILPSLINSQTYITEQVIYTGLTSPVAFCFFPNTNVIVTEKAGRVKVYTLGNLTLSTFWDFTDSCLSMGEGGTLGVCVDPAFSTNHYVYLFYTYKRPPVCCSSKFRVIRFTENNNIGTNPLQIFECDDNAPNGNTHFGGNMRFGRDGKLYISVGYRNINAQSLTNGFGKIHRINSNGTIPTDNPFYDDGNPLTGNDDRIWAYGLRNSFDLCVSPINDSIYASENGDSIDEVNFIRKGKNYGYPICQGYCSPYNPAYRQPMATWSGPSLAPTGILVYNGSQMPELNNHLLVAGYNPGSYIYDCVLGNAPYYDTVTSRTQMLQMPYLTTLAQGADGYIYTMSISTGYIYRIKHNPQGIQNHNIPAQFSLEQNYPNPFNPATSIAFSVNKKMFVSIKIYDVLGNEIQTLVNGIKEPGTYNIEWPVDNEQDASSMPSGVYFYRMSGGEQSIEKKMVLLK